MTMISTASMFNNSNDDDTPTKTLLPSTMPALLWSMSASFSYQQWSRVETASNFDGPSRTVRLKQQHGSSPGVEEDAVSTLELPASGMISYNCLIMPVFFGIWWFWFRRKASSVVQTLLLITDQRHNDTSGRDTASSQGQGQSTATRTRTRTTTTTAMPISDGPGSGSSNSWDWEHVSWSKDDYDQFSTW